LVRRKPLFFKGRAPELRKTWCHVAAAILRIFPVFPLILWFLTLRSWCPSFYEAAMFFRVKLIFDTAIPHLMPS